MRRLLLVVCLLFPAIAQSQWPTTEWFVECEPWALDILGPEACDDANPDGPAGRAKARLESASEFFQDRGFRAPDVRLQDGFYIASIANESELAGIEEEWGWYVWDADSGKIILSMSLWGIGAAGDYRGSGSHLAGILPHSYTAVHLLFHAIQRSYVPTSLLQSDEHFWIWDGTAEMATVYQYFFETGSQPETDPPQILSDSRHHSRDADADLNAYLFWLTANQIAEGGSLFLQELFETDLEPSRGISGTHEALSLYADYGLYKVFPQVIAKIGFSYYFDETDDAYHEDLLDLAALPYVEASYDGVVRPVAAHAYDIQVTSAHSDPVGVTAWIEGDEDNLHLIVNGELYNDWARGGDKHNVYESILPGGERDTLHIRVVNISRDPARSADQAYTLKVALERVEPCSEASLSAALNPFGSEMQAEVRRAEIQRDGMLYLDTAGTVYTLGQGQYFINGDGGIACVSHFGVSDLEWINRQNPYAPDPEDEMERVFARHMPRLVRESGLSEAQIRAIAEGNAPSGGVTNAQIMRLMNAVREIAAEPQTGSDEFSGVYFHIFEPSLATVMGGGIAPERLRYKDVVATRHAGVGGWRPNSASNLIVYMPGTQASEIEAGGSYDAIAYSLSDEPPRHIPEGPQTGSAFYTWWHGEYVQYRCDGERMEEFDGIQQTIWGQLEGTVQIESVSPAAVSGSFSLSGAGQREMLTYSLERTGDLDCPRRQEIVEDFGPTSVSASGSFVAPNFQGVGTFVIAGQGRAVPVGQ